MKANKNDLHESGRPYTKEEFINKIKTDDEFAKKWGDLGKIYGFQWRNWTNYTGDEINEGTYEMTNEPIDQITNLINDLKTNSDSRRLMVNAWNPSELDQMVLPPCHYGFQVYTRELSEKERMNTLTQNEQRLIYEEIQSFKNVRRKKIKDCLDEQYIPTRAISLMYNARSQDVPLGTPFNIASYALLLEIIAKMVNMVPDELITNMGDCHIYLNQIDGIKEQLTREPYPLPKLVISNQVNFNGSINEFLNSCLITDFKIEGYQSHPTIKIPLSN
jgi:thymidylate synthase